MGVSSPLPNELLTVSHYTADSRGTGIDLQEASLLLGIFQLIDLSALREKGVKCPRLYGKMGHHIDIYDIGGGIEAWLPSIPTASDLWLITFLSRKYMIEKIM